MLYNVLENLRVSVMTQCDFTKFSEFRAVLLLSMAKQIAEGSDSDAVSINIDRLYFHLVINYVFDLMSDIQQKYTFR